MVTFRHRRRDGFLATGESLVVGQGCVVCCALWNVFPSQGRAMCAVWYLQRLHCSRVHLCDRSMGTLHYICLLCLAILGTNLIANAFRYKYTCDAPGGAFVLLGIRRTHVINQNVSFALL